MDNFDLKKFIIENKLARASKLVENEDVNELNLLKPLKNLFWKKSPDKAKEVPKEKANFWYDLYVNKPKPEAQKSLQSDYDTKNQALKQMAGDNDPGIQWWEKHTEQELMAIEDAAKKLGISLKKTEGVNESGKLEEINKKDVEEKIKEALRDVLFVSKDGRWEDRYLNREHVLGGKVSKQDMAKRYDEVISIIKNILMDYETTKNGYKSSNESSETVNEIGEKYVDFNKFPDFFFQIKGKEFKDNGEQEKAIRAFAKYLNDDVAGTKGIGKFR